MLTVPFRVGVMFPDTVAGQAYILGRSGRGNVSGRHSIIDKTDFWKFSFPHGYTRPYRRAGIAADCSRSADGVARHYRAEGLPRGGRRHRPLPEEQRGLFIGACAAVVRPASTAEVAEVVRLCAEAGVPVVPQGGNTGLVGGGVPGGGVVLPRGSTASAPSTPPTAP